MNALRFAVFGKSRLAATRCHAIARHAGTQIVQTLPAADVSGFGETDWRNALDPRSIDAAIFALPADMAAKAACLALEAGIHVLNELPGGRTVEDIINLRDAERKSPAILKFGCGLRYHASVQAALARIGEGDFGRLLTVRAVYGHAGFPGPEASENGILAGHGIHMLDLLHLFCGPFEGVKAMRSGEASAETNVFAILKTGDGTVAQLHCSATSWRQTFRVELGFEHGYVWLDGHLPGLAGYGPEMLIHARVQRDADGKPVANPAETIEEYTDTDVAADELADFVEAMAGRASLRHGPSHQAFDAMNIMQRICAAAETWA